ncbi:hypothetical protein [Mesorhizobium amorphae]|uniref:hypothetical protein n=1 Tax=Mesorhizobium amorphae TaxID=71433 RepID=UPI001182EB91|nr:hypothetical protein [Mesorhizobium amorphae]
MARPKLGDSETERLHVKITSDEIKAIDDWRYTNRVPSRSDAVRRLVQIGLIFDAHADRLREALRGLSETLIEQVKKEPIKEVRVPSNLVLALTLAGMAVQPARKMRETGDLTAAIKEAEAELEKSFLYEILKNADEIRKEPGGDKDGFEEFRWLSSKGQKKESGEK